MTRDAIEFIRELVNKYGDSAKDIISSGMNIEHKGNGRYRCPNIHEHKNSDKNPSMGWVSDGHYFHCMRCGESINIYTYLSKYLGNTFTEIMQSENIDGFITRRNDFLNNKQREVNKITEEQKAYCKSRGLTEETIKYFKLSNANGDIGIPYFNNGFLTGVKKKLFNKSGSIKNLSVTGSYFGLFNSDNADFNKPLILTEGEWDCFIVHQCGYSNVVSVGTGANAIKKIIEICGDFISKFPEVILFTDDDEPGKELDEELKSNFKNIVEVDKSLYRGEKDANDIYLKYDKVAIEEVLASAKFSVSGLIDPSNLTYEEISSVNKGKFIPTGFISVDTALNDLRPGYTTLVTGRANDGKSTLVLQIIANAIENDSKVFWVSGEETAKDLYLNLLKLVVGNSIENYNLVKENKDVIKVPKPEVYSKIKKWHEGKLEIFNKGESRLKNTSEILDMVRIAVKKNGLNLVVIDNLMSLLSARSTEKNEAQADFMQSLHDIAQSTNCHIILVLHPNKELRKGQDMEFEMISGTSDLPNKADNVLFVRKAHCEENEARGIHGHINVLKNRKKSSLPKIDTRFDFETGMLSEIDERGNATRYKYSWDKKEEVLDYDKCPF